jgi:hypothetical protein
VGGVRERVACGCAGGRWGQGVQKGRRAQAGCTACFDASSCASTSHSEDMTWSASSSCSIDAVLGANITRLGDML